MKRVAVFGGSFNPIHLGHMHLISEVDARRGFDEILLIPSRIPPHKSAAAMVDGAHRYAMCALAAARLGARVHASDLELTQPKKSYTVYTLERLRAARDDAQFTLVMGGDMLLTLDRWHRCDDLLRMAEVVAAARNDGEYAALVDKAAVLQSAKPFARIAVEQIEPLPMSSTEIREKLAAGRAVSDCLAPEVYAYILEHHLYRVD